MMLLMGLAWSTGCDRGDHPSQLGTRAPLFTLNDGQRSLDLRALRGQVVVLNFWATWCAPCLAELPALEQMQRELPQVRVIAVATDESAETYRDFLERRPVPLFTIFDATQKANTMYGTFAFPETYVIDKQGTIRRKFISAQEWTSPEIESFLRKLAA